METAPSKPPTRKALPSFQPRHELRYGVKGVETDAEGVVCLAECQFCRCFGREGVCPKRKRTQKIKYYKPPYRTQYYVQHNQVAHAAKWATYQTLDDTQKWLFFSDCPPTQQTAEEAPAPKRPAVSEKNRSDWTESEVLSLVASWEAELRMTVLEFDTSDTQLGVSSEDARVYRRFVAGMGGLSRHSAEEMARKKAALKVTCAFIRAYNKGQFPTKGHVGKWDWFALPASERREAEKRAAASEAWNQVQPIGATVFAALDTLLPAEEEPLTTPMVFSALSRSMDESLGGNRAIQPPATSTNTSTSTQNGEVQVAQQSIRHETPMPEAEGVAYLMKKQHQELMVFLRDLKGELKADMLAERARAREHDAKEREAERRLHTQEREKDRALLREMFEMFLQQSSRN